MDVEIVFFKSLTSCKKDFKFFKLKFGQMLDIWIWMAEKLEQQTALSI